MVNNTAAVPVQKASGDFVSYSLPEPDFALATVMFIIPQLRMVKLPKHGQKPPNCCLQKPEQLESCRM